VNIYRVRNTRFWKGNLLGRLTNWITYTLLALYVGIFKIKPRILIVNTDPPFLGIVGYLLKKYHKVPLIFNCRDLYPDVAIELGEIKDGFITKIFDYLNKLSFLESDKIVPLGISMKNKILKKGIEENKFYLIPDWADTKFLKPIIKSKNSLLKDLNLKNRFIIMYSGNIGFSQDFETILEAFKKIDSENATLIFVGEGAAKESLRRAVSDLELRNVMFLTYQPFELLDQSLNIADLHLVPLKEGLSGSIVPSKVYGILSVGKPYLAIADEDSEPVTIAKNNNCGLWARPGDVDGISEKLKWAVNNKELLLEMGRKGREVAVKNYDKKIVISKWVDLLSTF
ncbi:MAG: glycosyltransferase family 4 protein, partial [Thermodesulfobacteriota bacterium]